jgi:hypothetical protein
MITRAMSMPGAKKASPQLNLKSASLAKVAKNTYHLMFTNPALSPMITLGKG